ncbi:MAG: TlpA disulfide reductase family protein [Ferruginibacter sp.]
MKKLFFFSLIFYACNNAPEKGRFTITGEVRNIEDQQVYLEQLFFSGKNPEVLDTATIKAGKFCLSGTAGEQGLYRLRLEKVPSGFLFINDQPAISFSADIKDVSLDGPKFISPANEKLKTFLKNIDGQGKKIEQEMVLLDSFKTLKNNDSAVNAKQASILLLQQNFSNYIASYLDTVSNPVLAMFALGYSRSVDPVLLKKIVPNIGSRFPAHQGIAGLINQFNTAMLQMDQSQQQKSNSAPGMPKEGDIAPDFTMNDTAGVPFTLSSLKGKYVLIDFWASWCGPCRAENPGLVTAYNKLNNKNFTILGVSLDESKEKWLNAIKADKLAWKQVSDLKWWKNATVALYGYDAIPYNVLIDPSGKIIARELQGEELEKKLLEFIK